MSDVKIVYRLDKSREIATPEVVAAFKQIVRSHDSKAVWLSQAGIIVTDDPDEPAKNHPYADWIEQVVREVNS